MTCISVSYTHLDVYKRQTLLRHLKAHTSSGDKDFQYKSNINVKQIFTEEEEVSRVN